MDKHKSLGLENASHENYEEKPSPDEKHNTRMEENCNSSLNIEHSYLNCDNSGGSTKQMDYQKYQITKEQSILEYNKLRLVDLPHEVLLVLFSYLDARFTLTVLSCVCKLFHYLLLPEAIWKTRCERRWESYNVTKADSYISSWKQVCVQTEDIHKCWFSYESNLNFYQLRNHFAPVDAVHIMCGGSVCLSGSRDRYVCVWDISKLDKNIENQEQTLKCSFNDHNGWVWALASDPCGEPRFCSGAWDNTVRFWDLTSQKHMTTIRKEHKAAVLCMQWRPDVFITGSYDKHVRMFDLRENLENSKPLKSFRAHSKPILCMVADDHYIITESEDKTLHIYDRRAASTFKIIEVQSPVFSLHRSNYGCCYLLAGCRGGKINLYETINGTFDKLQTIDSGHQNKVTGICQVQGSIVTCSWDNSVKVLNPCAFSNVCTYYCHDGEVATVHSSSGVLASASSDLTVGIWRQ